MIRVLAVCPVPADGTAWWRVVSPLGVMKQDWPGLLEFEISHEPDHVKLSGVDLLLLQRPMRDGDLALLRHAKRLCIPVVVDYDDDYTGVPPHNPRAHHYMNDAIQRKIRSFLTEADVVVVSTPDLKRKLMQHNKRTVVIPNGLDDRLFTHKPAVGKLRPRTVVWRGGDSHIDDLAGFKEAMVKAAHETPTAIWHFVGHPAGEFIKRMPPGTVVDHPFLDVLAYFGKLAELEPHILVVPLADTHFNRCKSNISILEGTWAGAVVVAPKWPGWSVPGVLSYESPAHMSELLRGALRMRDAELSALRNQAWEAVRTKALASRFNMFRAAVFTELVREAKGKRFERPEPILAMPPPVKEEVVEEVTG